MLRNPKFLLGENYERLEQFVLVLGEICTKKAQCETATWDKVAVLIANVFQDPTLGEQVKKICQERLTEQQRAKLQECYGTCNEEVRARVTAAMAQQ